MPDLCDEERRKERAGHVRGVDVALITELDRGSRLLLVGFLRLGVARLLRVGVGLCAELDLFARGLGLLARFGLFWFPSFVFGFGFLEIVFRRHRSLVLLQML